MLRRLQRLFFSCWLCGIVWIAVDLGLPGGIPFAAAEEPATTSDSAAVTERLQTGWMLNAFPFGFFTPETSLGGGGILLATHRAEGLPSTARADTISAMLFATFRGQAMFAVDPEIHFDEGRWSLRSTLSGRYYPERYYGVGPNTHKDSREDFTARGIRGSITLNRRLVSSFHAGATVHAGRTDLVKTEPGKLMETHPPFGAQGGTQIGIGPVFEWDTRDNPFYPTRGSYAKLSSVFFRRSLGGDFDFTQTALDGRKFWMLKPAHIFAIQGLISSGTGDVPFNSLIPVLLRGIHFDRFKDKTSAHVQGEYRFPISGRFSGAAFAGLGNVAPDLEALRLGGLKWAGGGGIRYALNRQEKINLRIDLGFSASGASPYILFREAF